MTEEMKTLGVRLAIRREGEWVNAYLATVGTMDDARLLGSILKGVLERDDRLWEQWKDLMTSAFRAGVEDIVGVSPTMVEQAAPLHEKAGNA